MESIYDYTQKWMIKDRIISFTNKTHVSEQEARRVALIVRKKYKISVADALRKMINAWFDKRIEIKEQCFYSEIGIKKVYTVENAEDI